MGKQKTFGEVIRELRKAKNLTQRELAERVAARLREEDGRGFDFTYLSKIENDRLPPPSAEAIMQLAAELDANSDDLLLLAKKAPPGLRDALKKSEGARLFYRSALEHGLSEEDWLNLLKELECRKRGQGE